MKTSISTKWAFIALAITIVSSTLSFRPKENIAQVMIYGIVYTTACNSYETYQHYRYKLVPESSYNAERNVMRKELESRYPNAKRIRVESSRYDYGSAATNMCIIKWTNTKNNCQYDVLSVHFGKTEQEALNKATSHKSEWADRGAPSSIVIQKYW
jgi:hypothetical protein